MKRIILLLTVVALMVALAVPAFAQAIPDRGPGPCVPPGTVHSGFAQVPDSNPTDYFEPYGYESPGQAVSELCAPGQQ